MNTNRILLTAILVVLSVTCAWAGGPSTAITFNDIQGTVGIANGGTGQTASSAALAALGGEKAGYNTVGSGTAGAVSVIKTRILYGTTAAAEGGDVAVNHGLTRANIKGMRAVVHGDTVSSPMGSTVAGYVFTAYINDTSIVIRLAATPNSASITEKPVVIEVDYEE